MRNPAIFAFCTISACVLAISDQGSSPVFAKPKELVHAMKMRLQILPVILVLGLIRNLVAGQVPHLAETPDIPLSSRDRVYTADQTSNTLSVYDPSSNRLVGCSGWVM
jgi:hypothetical protein